MSQNEKKSSTGSGKNSQFIYSKKYIARKLKFTYGRLNGDIKLVLAVAQGTKQVHA